MSHPGTLSWPMAYRNTKLCSRNGWVTNTKVKTGSLSYHRAWTMAPEPRGCTAWPSNPTTPVKKNRCCCSSDAVLQACPLCMPSEPQAQRPCHEEPTHPLLACLRPSPKSPPGEVSFYAPIHMHGRRGHHREWATPPSGKSLGIVSTRKNFLEVSSHSAPSCGFSWRRGQRGLLFI